MTVTVKIFTKHGGRPTLFQSRDFDALPVTIGRDYGTTLEIVAGLQPSDSVVLNPSDSLEDGQQVAIAQGAAQ